MTTTPIPLSEIERIVKRIHVKLPSNALYPVFIGNYQTQDFLLEPGDRDVLEIANPKNVYVRSLGDVTLYVMLEYLQAPPLANASGIDPNDPTWAPADGWDKVWEFASDAELTDFATDIYYASVQNHRVVFDPPSEDYAYARRTISDVNLRKAAICFRVSVVSVSDVAVIVSAAQADGTSMWGAWVSSTTAGTDKLALVDAATETQVAFANPNDWMVLVVDFESKVARVYDRNGNVLAELSLGTTSWDQVWYDIFLQEDDETSYTIDDVEVDWVAIKLA